MHRALDDDGDLTFAYWVSRVCEEFQCLPSAAEQEMRRQPVGWIEEVIEARHYAKAKAIYDHAPDKTDVVKHDPLLQLVEENEYAHAKDLIVRRRAHAKAQGKKGTPGG